MTVIPKLPLAIIASFAQNDSRLIRRDQFLTGLVGVVALFSLLLRFGVPWLDRQPVMTQLPFTLMDYYPLLVCYFGLFQTLLLGGMIAGFLTLDDYDHNTLAALQVTRMSLLHYVSYRILMSSLLAFIFMLVVFGITGAELLTWWQVPLLALSAAPGAAIIALILAVFSDNKVQGFAMIKMVSGLGVLLVAGWFVPLPWQWLFALLPPFLPILGYQLLLGNDSSGWLILALGFGYGLLATGLLGRRLIVKVGQAA